MRASTDLNDLIKDKRVWIPAAIVLAGIIGGGVWYVMSGTEHGSDAASLPPAGSLPAGAPGAALPGASGSSRPGVVGASGAPIAVGSAGVAPIGANPSLNGQTRPATTATVPGKSIAVPNSWAGAPLGYGGATGTVTTGGGSGGMGGGIPTGIQMPTGGGLPKSGGVASAGTKPTPIRSNTPAQLARIDPFVPFYKLIVEQTPAFSLIVPDRLASRPTPTPPPTTNIPPEIRFGPLPPVERRVAGVLFDGSVSAILETGTPGAASTDVRVIQPGATVPSGFANPDTLTVASISPVGVVLRAADGRTTTVKLSNVSAEFADAFHNTANGSGINPGGSPGSSGQPSGQTGFGSGGGRRGAGAAMPSL